MIFKKKKLNQIPAKKEQFNMPSPLHHENKISEIALVIDGVIQDSLFVEERLAAILLSDPIICDISYVKPRPLLGWKYNEESGEFKNPNEVK
jgi:hypothetical protein